MCYIRANVVPIKRYITNSYQQQASTTNVFLLILIRNVVIHVLLHNFHEDIHKQNMHIHPSFMHYIDINWYWSSISIDNPGQSNMWFIPTLIILIYSYIVQHITTIAHGAWHNTTLLTKGHIETTLKQNHINTTLLQYVPTWPVPSILLAREHLMLILKQK